MIETEQKHLHDFGAKNIVLIAIVALVLAVLAWNQRPIRTAALQGGMNLNASLISSSGDNQAKVLGASEYNKQLMAQFSDIEIQTSTDNSKTAFLSYSSQLRTVLVADRAEILLNGSILERTKTAQDKLLSDLKRIAAPSVLADYHRLTVAYYKLRFEQQTSLNADELSVYVSAVQSELDKMRQDYFVSAGVQLP